MPRTKRIEPTAGKEVIDEIKAINPAITDHNLAKVVFLDEIVLTGTRLRGLVEGTQYRHTKYTEAKRSVTRQLREILEKVKKDIFAVSDRAAIDKKSITELIEWICSHDGWTLTRIGEEMGEERDMISRMKLQEFGRLRKDQFMAFMEIVERLAAEDFVKRRDERVEAKARKLSGRNSGVIDLRAGVLSSLEDGCQPVTVDLYEEGIQIIASVEGDTGLVEIEAGSFAKKVSDAVEIALLSIGDRRPYHTSHIPEQGNCSTSPSIWRTPQGRIEGCIPLCDSASIQWAINLS